MSVNIEPRLLKGFRDTLPGDERSREQIIQTLSSTFKTYGFVPIDTPVLEYAEILLGKGGGETDKQVYRFDDQGGRDVAMRFDLTVPFARFMAGHRNELYLPFKRYHIAKAWRGENTQRGRYREFMQCDFDIVGTAGLSADLEIILLMRAAFTALGVADVEIHVAHRGLFNRLLTHVGVGDHSEAVLRAVDKLRKIGEAEVRSLVAAEIGAEAADAVMAFIVAGDSNEATLQTMEEAVGGPSPEGARIRAVLEGAAAAGFSTGLVLDPSITRGLDYYTGIVFETFLRRLPEIGSVCSGGRYDDLASLFTKEQLPGVGASIGIDRLMAGLEELGVSSAAGGAADVMILCLTESLTGHYHAIAAQLRAEGWAVDVFPEGKKLGQQFAFAEKKGIPVALICGESEHAGGTVNLRNLGTRETFDGLTIAEADAQLRAILQK